MSTTTYIGLIMPELAATSKIRTDFNSNMEIIDGRFSATYLAVQAKNAVTITGGSITGITDITVTDGGTGVSTLTNGGVLLGSGTEAITAMAVLADGEIIVGNGTTDPVAESGATARASLGLTIGTHVQAYDAGLLSIAALTTAANKMIYTTASDTYATTTLSAFGITLIDDADASAARTTLGLAIGTNVQAYDAQLADIAALAVTDGNIIVGDGTNWIAESGATARTSLGLAIGTNVQAYDAALTSISGLTYVSPSFIKLTANDTYAVRTLAQTLTDIGGAALQGVSAIGAVTFVDATHILSVATITYWFGGATYTTASPTTCDIDTYETLTTNTLYYFYFDDATGTLKCSDTTWNFYTQVHVATVFWNGTNGVIQKEWHNSTRNLAWHEWANNTIGTRYEAGLSLTAPTTADDATLTIASGSIKDEDLLITIEQQTTCRIVYKASASIYTWVNSSLPYAGASADPKWLDTDNYTLTSVGDSDFVCMWVYATSDVDRPIYIIPTHAAAAHNVIALARAETAPVLSSLNLNPEMKLIYRFIYKGDGQFQEFNDYRLTSPLPSGGSASTNASAVSFSPAGNIAATTVQTALEEVDTEKAKIGANSDITSLTGLTTPLSVVQGGTGAATLSSANLSDVDLTDIGDEKILKYNLATGNWECEVDTGGTVDISGTPVANDYARFTDADTIEGREYSEVKTDLSLIKCRDNATEAPVVTNDSTEGYAVNSVWGDVTNDKSYICLDATATAAVWKRISWTSGQIDFPTTQNPSADANTLDDYEEGTWTAVIRGAGTAGTYEIATQFCNYTKIGRTVHLDGYILLAASITGGGTDYLQITGCPFPKMASANTIGVVGTSGVDFTGTQLNIRFITNSETSVLYIVEMVDNASAIDLPVASISANDTISFSITFFTN